jgi:pimeloyl-ACP methyl ester carboxylesterase
MKGSTRQTRGSAAAAPLLTLLILLAAVATARGDDTPSDDVPAPRPETGEPTTVVPEGSAPTDDAPAAEPPARPFSVQVTGEGPAVILIPGLSCASNAWEKTAVHLAATHRVHAVTIAGFGGEARVEDFSLSRVRDALVAYVRDGGIEKPVLVGHSLGGFLALWIAAEVPDLVGGVVSVDGVPYFPALVHPDADPESYRAKADALRTVMEALSPAAHAAQTRAVLRGMVSDEDERERMAATCAKSDPPTVAQAFYELMTIDLRTDVKKIRVPVLLVGALKAVPEPLRDEARENYRRQVAAIPHVEVVFAPDSLHFVQLDQPAWLHEALDRFLAAVAKARAEPESVDPAADVRTETAADDATGG